MSLADHEFLRMATPQDAERLEGTGVGNGWSLWKAPDQSEGWLSPEDVMRHGLTDRMRQAMADDVDAAGGPVVVNHGSAPVEADERHSGLRAAPPTTHPLDSPGGYSPVWRWQRVVDTDAECKNHGAGTTCDDCVTVLWCIDNKPAIEAWAKGDKVSPCPELQRVTIPAEIIRVIAST